MNNFDVSCDIEKTMFPRTIEPSPCPSQGVTTYAQNRFASFSQSPVVHIPIKDRSTSGYVYLYHFEVENIINNNRRGKRFDKQ